MAGIYFELMGIRHEKVINKQQQKSKTVYGLLIEKMDTFMIINTRDRRR